MEFENYGSLNQILDEIDYQNPCVGCLNDCGCCENKFKKRATEWSFDRTSGNRRKPYQTAKRKEMPL